MTGPQRMNARYSGTCRCGAAFARGAAIIYSRAVKGVVGCFECKPEMRTEYARAVDSDTAYEDQCAAACGLDRE